MKGGPSDTSWGFTLVETLIVLAVSGMILFSALAVVSGRQSRTQFDVSIRQAQQSMQSTINEVSSGYYPSTNNFACSQPNYAVKQHPVISTVGARQQGSNQGCIFLGKVVQLAPSGNSAQTVTITVAGNAKDTTGGDVTSLDAAQPLAVYPGSSGSSSPVKSETIGEFQYGLSLVRAYWTSLDTANTTQTDIGAFGLLASFPGTDTYGTQSGSNSIDLYAVNGSTVGQTTTAVVDLINSNSPNGGVNLRRVGSINFCLASGGTDQSGLITIGGNGNQSSVTLKIFKGKTCS